MCTPQARRPAARSVPKSLRKRPLREKPPCPCYAYLKLSSTRAVAPRLRIALRTLEILISAVFAVFLRRARQRLTALDRNAMRCFGLRHGDLVLAFRLGLARVLRSVRNGVAVAFLLCFDDVLLCIRHLVLGVGLGIREVALRFGLRVRYIALDLSRRFGLITAEGEACGCENPQYMSLHVPVLCPDLRYSTFSLARTAQMRAGEHVSGTCR